MFLLNEIDESKSIINNVIPENNNIVDNKSLWDSFKYIISNIKDVIKNTMKSLKLDEIGLAILEIIRGIPIIGRLIPNQKDKENEAKGIVGTISIGNGVTKCMNILQFIFKSVWNLFPLPNKYKNNVIKPIFNYNSRQTFLQTLYKMMLDADISQKHANAYLMVLALKIPIYNMLYVFKPFWSKAKVNQTEDDKLHPFTSGDPVTNPETGLNECEQILQKKVQQFIQIKKIAVMNESDNTLELNSKLNRAIIKESLLGLLVAFVLPSIKFFSICFGQEGGIYEYGNNFVSFLLCLYYYYFLVTSMILTSLAIENEETFHPSKKEDKNNNKLSSDGTIDFHQS